MKIQLWANAFSNITYDRKEVVDSDYSKEEWEDLTSTEKEAYLNELAQDFVWNDIDAGAEVVEE